MRPAQVVHTNVDEMRHLEPPEGRWVLTEESQAAYIEWARSEGLWNGKLIIALSWDPETPDIVYVQRYRSELEVKGEGSDSRPCWDGHFIAREERTYPITTPPPFLHKEWVGA
jgi:hypothetical protein